MSADGNNFFPLDDMNIVVTGGTCGIGLEIAKRFAAAGANVVIVGRRKEGAAIAKTFGASFIMADVADEAAQRQMFDTVVGNLGKLDVLVLNAGVGDDFPAITETSTAGMRRLIETNIFGVFWGLKYGPAALKDGGAVICTSSASSQTYLPGLGPYGASKQTVNAMVRASAMELGARKICVNAVCPGGFASEMAPYDAENDKTVGRMTALGRAYMTSNELVGLYHLLASPEGRFITGQAIRVDGGFGLGYGAHFLTKKPGKHEQTGDAI